MLLPFLFSCAVIFLGYGIIFRGGSSTGIVLFAYFIALVLVVLPVLILHVQYLINDFNLVVTIFTDRSVIEFRRGKLIERFDFNQIQSLDYYATAGHISKKGVSTAFYSFDNYRFYRVEFKDKRKYYVTCLVMNDIEHQLEDLTGIKADWSFRALPLLY